ncbi:hypothetical protein NVP1076O_36 [Vibrio phage 1.076.O._10N.286.51.B7]|nr:hypothetical protein NVP1076O_36 [Vibrio phage 1.076.O._10N.286.51.B7]
MNARKNRGTGNDNAKAWNSPFWDSVKKPTGDCKHLNTKFTNDGQVCKNCGETIKKVGG